MQAESRRLSIRMHQRTVAGRLGWRGLTRTCSASTVVCVMGGSGTAEGFADGE